MHRLEVSGAVRLIYKSLGVKELRRSSKERCYTEKKEVRYSPFQQLNALPFLVVLVPLAFGALVARWLVRRSILFCSHVLTFPTMHTIYILHSGNNGYSVTSYVSDGLHHVTSLITVAAWLRETIHCVPDYCNITSCESNVYWTVHHCNS